MVTRISQEGTLCVPGLPDLGFTGLRQQREVAMKRCGGLLLMVLTAGAVGADLPPWLLERSPGQSWQQDTSGIWRGTGTNRGQSWQQDTSGHWHGTGTNRGQVWQQDTPGFWRGTGTNRGQVWQRDPSGIWRGTGTNRGESWRQDRPGAWRGSGKAKALDAPRARP